MKKTIILLAISSIILFACNPLKPSSSAVTSYFESSDSIPGNIADSMIEHYHMDTILVDHSSAAIIRQITLYNSDLYKMFKTKKITRVRLLVAAYLATDSVTRRNKPMVLVQLKKGYHSNIYYYDLQKSGTGRICPPPPGCSPLANP